MNAKGLTALVTGASSGIGEAIARRLAEAGANLVITARRKDRLDALAVELQRNFGVVVSVIVVDLGAPGGAASLFSQTEGVGNPIDVLINNAGFGTQEWFAEIPWEKVREQVQVNVVTLTELTHRFVAPMLARGRGFILNVASTGAFMPVPCFATYGAGKAYVLSFSEALAYELRGSPVRVCCLCPGGTATEFSQTAGHRLPPLVVATLMPADRCAQIGLAALFRGRRMIIAGLMNVIMIFTLRFLPRRVTAMLAAIFMSKKR